VGILELFSLKLSQSKKNNTKLEENIMNVKKMYSTVKVGDTVTTLVNREAFGSNYAGVGLVEFTSEDVGIVTHVKRPNLRCSDAYKNEAVIVDFEKNGKKERVSLWYQHIKLL
jgi:hypothetical protein